MGRRGACCGAWLLLAAFAQPQDDGLGYDLAAVAADEQLSAPATQPPAPGEQYPPRLADQAPPPPPTPPSNPDRPRAQWRLTTDASVTADSNVTNSTDRETIDLDFGDVVLPVPLDPSLRQHGGVGVAFSAAASGRVPVADGTAAALDAEGYVLEHDGRLSDDMSFLLAAGVELTDGDGGILLVQLTGFERRYAGRSAMRGFGLRGRLVQPVGEGQRLSLLVDVRSFDSAYGDDFGGTEAGAYLSYDIALAPNLSASAGAYARGSWLGAEAYSNREFGVQGGLNRYFGPDFTGGISAGVSRLAFDGPILLLSPDPRRDWRWYASAYLTTRRPVVAGLTPSLTYTFNRTGSSIEFYRAERHRLRFGLSRTF